MPRVRNGDASSLELMAFIDRVVLPALVDRFMAGTPPRDGRNDAPPLATLAGTVTNTPVVIEPTE